MGDWRRSQLMSLFVRSESVTPSKSWYLHHRCLGDSLFRHLVTLACSSIISLETLAFSPVLLSALMAFYLFSPDPLLKFTCVSSHVPLELFFLRKHTFNDRLVRKPHQWLWILLLLANKDIQLNSIQYLLYSNKSDYENINSELSKPVEQTMHAGHAGLYNFDRHSKRLEIIQDSLVPDYFRSQWIERHSLQHPMLLHQRQPKSVEVKLAWQILLGGQIRTIKKHQRNRKIGNASA